MNILILGSGAREHALAWKIRQSALVSKLTVAPGNPGIGAISECAPVDLSSVDDVVRLALSLHPDLVVVGPEAPLVLGVADALRASGFVVFGPDKGAAQIEGSKAFAKEVMQAAGVPTAKAEVFDDAEAAAKRAFELGAVVVKADGLAAGKGVVVSEHGQEAAEVCRSLGRMPAGRRILLEEKLTGPELSVIALCDGVRFVLLPSAQDHKRLLDGDRGPNTGGMGAYSPAPLLSPEGLAQIGEQIIAPTLRELARRNAPFRGALYAGLMLTPHGPKVIEFNCRMGDPETQPMMMQLDEDLVPLLLACAKGQLTATKLRVKPGVSVGVVLASAGYPQSPQLGDPISGLDAPDDPNVLVFHAGTKKQGDQIVTAGGRVVTVCAHGATFEAARSSVYQAVAKISFRDCQMRSDIGMSALR